MDKGDRVHFGRRSHVGQDAFLNLLVRVFRRVAYAGINPITLFLKTSSKRSCSCFLFS